ncbi:bifunctional riboflavin kinase/FAD synthetase [Elizabethkingia bruuniana]|uniref:Riboflavin biosynthesis protein n=1 Tax=Elizabethkingia bruuniana TaxID=1756149 RepID=A0A7T7UX64_9FLAO|nr:bifunctional riboflavin kinase/FAD synthetase [Elizabethkingia bruuniana]KGO09706.1 riboflavin biosynthesis protein RibF [Elizabethkingia miricola]AQX84403.1 bifunctional riboflavin kinase/FMN adenylyltransferase [Elizabethkingia bruuniana]KUY27857.1 bifunctional riboflavin kinase/FMN adenylyltransferase [Elizabethkingia bruuniana]OPB64819.1 riboflavin biosynthesis protein RibF [Elizabethkingia bruuniana]QQN57843.1 bifunctional riboflavin kinase/FAD synthetase [Elizabethkingia bruuniana]
MKIVKNIAEYSDAMGLTMSLGMFDGVHKGHQEIIKKLKKHSETHQLESALLTFWPHPRKVLQPEVEIKLLNTLEEKLQLLERFGIQKTFLQEFNDDFRNLSGEDFVKQILLDKLHMKHIVIGYDHHFGKNKSGNFELLEKMASENNFVVEETKAVLVNELAVSSTKIRNALSEGDIITANEFLGYHYPVSGTVVAGKKIGRTIGYPTANIDVDPIKLLPKNGAYIVDVELNRQMYKGMLSIGTNPTVNGTKKTTEVYILDFDQDIYGENITVYFRDYLHDEIKFESLEKLIERLDEDKQLTIDFFK